jgi:hypothetical protein
VLKLAIIWIKIGQFGSETGFSVKKSQKSIVEVNFGP